MTNSLMIEGIVSFLISVYLYYIIEMYKRKDMTSFIFFLSFGGMVLTKNFVSLISLLLIICGVFLIGKNFFLLAGLVIYGFNLFYQNIYFSEVQRFAYTSEIDFKDLLFDFLYIRDLNFTNISNILDQFLIDKPTTYIVVGFLIVNIVNFYKYRVSLETNVLMFSVVILNYVLVNLLYISYWRNIEFESSYRYIVTCFHLIFISLVITISKFEKT